MKKLLLSLAALAILPAFAQNEITLSFDVDGETDPSAVVVYVEGMSGVTASVKSCNADLKELSDPTIFCPNINGNAGMDVILELELKGLPAGTSFNKAGFYAWAYNGGGTLQTYPWDEKERHFNVEVAVDNKVLVDFTNIDIAGSVTQANSGAEFIKEGVQVSASDPCTVELHITSGTTNVGCFFGLEKVYLFTAANDSGINTIETENTPVEFFDFQGRKVANPSNGIFIRKQGNSISKVTVK